MKYNITIKDNETGEVMQVFDTNVIIGVIGGAEGRASGICLTRCAKEEVANAVVTAVEVIDEVVECASVLKLMVSLREIKEIKSGKVDERL